jgi:hypothetical protein
VQPEVTEQVGDDLAAEALAQTLQVDADRRLRQPPGVD